MNIAISGASGYLGQRIKNELLLKNFNVISLCRNAKNKNELNFYLGKESIDSIEFKKNKIEVLIHCAWDMSNLSEKESHKTNVVGSRKLLDEALKGGVKKIIFISSMSAFIGCKSTYGKNKMIVENYFLRKGATIIRPGLIWGEGDLGGMFNKLNNIAKMFPICPVISKTYIFMIHETDLIKFLITKIQKRTFANKVYTLAFPKAISFNDVVIECSKINKRRIILIPMPWQIFYVTLKLIETLNIPFPIKTDNLMGLIKTNPIPNIIKNAKKNFRPFVSLSK